MAARRIFEAKVYIVVDNDDATTIEDMKFTKDELESVLYEKVSLDIDIEDGGAATVGTDDNNIVGCAEIHWDTLKECVL